MTLTEIRLKAKYIRKLNILQQLAESLNYELQKLAYYSSLEYYFDKNDNEIGYYDNKIKIVNTDTANRLWNQNMKDQYHCFLLKDGKEIKRIK